MADKDMLLAGDVVLYYQNYFPVDFLHILSIKPDKAGWWQVEVLKLGMPSLKWTWLLDDNHICQKEWAFQGIPNRMQLYSRVIKQKIAPKADSPSTPEDEL